MTSLKSVVCFKGKSDLRDEDNNILISSNLDGVNDFGDVTLACDDDKRIQAHEDSFQS